MSSAPSKTLLTLISPNIGPINRLTRTIHSTSAIAMALKRKSAAQSVAGIKRATAATEYAAATRPGIPQTTPLSTLLETMHMHHEKVAARKGNIVHWFRSDMRLSDNRALHAANERAKKNGRYLIALYIVSPQVRLGAARSNNRIGGIIRRHQFEWISY